MKVISGHQPVYLPWLGLIHKASLSDIFIYMDDVQYLVRDWNNRNLLKTPQGNPIWLTVPVDLKNSPTRFLKDIRIASEENLPESKRWYRKHWMTLKIFYSRAPYFKQYKDFFEWLYMEKKWEKISELNLTILRKIFEWFDVKAELVIASEKGFEGKKSDLILDHGLKFKADVIFTGTYGKEYIDVDAFEKNGIKVVFQEYRHPVYQQHFTNKFYHISFVDLLFTHGPESRRIALDGNLTREEMAALIGKK